MLVVLPGLGADGTEIAVDEQSMAWLDSPGGAPDGYARYADDAVRARFTLPANLDLSTTQEMVLQVTNNPTGAYCHFFGLPGWQS